MSTLAVKLRRDLFQMWPQALAIAVVIACGVATLVMSLSTIRSLQNAQDAYYDRYRFAHVFARLKRAPQSLAARIAEIPGVGQVQTRTVAAVNLAIPGMAEPAEGRLISIPTTQAPRLNDLYLRAGRFPDPTRRGEVLVHEAFAEAHAMRPGDTLDAIINGRLQTLTVVGIALSPEFIYQIRPGDFIPDDRRFGVLWMPETELAPAFDMEGAFNDVSLTLLRGASQQAVIDALDRLTEPYAGLGAYGREDQTSHRYITDELTQLRGMAMLPPSVFLTVAAGLVNMVFTRLVGAQREQIAVIRAFGYSRASIARHYLAMVLVVAGVGVVLGIIGGVRLGSAVAGLYARFFRFPDFHFLLDFRAVLIAGGVTAGAAPLGALRSVARAAALPPAEAMRPEPPPSYRPTFVERLGLQRLLTSAARMVLRDLERRPVRALTSTLGLAFATAILVMGAFSTDAINEVLDFEFFTSQRQNVTITYVEPASGSARFEARNLPGVLHAESFRAVPARLRSGHREYRLAILGLEPDPTLRRLLSADRAEVPLPEDGIVLTANLADILGVRPGDDLTVEVLEGERPTRTVRVAALVDQLIGTAAYMDIRAVGRMMREGPTVTGAFLAADPAMLDELYATLKETPRVAGVTIKTAAIESFQETLAQTIIVMRLINLFFGVSIAFGVVYNSARISLAERSHELATLRVLGFTRGEISGILLGEMAVLTLVAIPIGLALGYGLAAFVTTALATETQRIPLVVYPSTFAFAASVVLIASLLSGLIVRRRLDHLDLVAVLKTRA